MFAFFIHPRDTSDEMDYQDLKRIKRMHGYLPFHWWIPIGWFTKLLSMLPRRLTNRVLLWSPPLVTGRIYSEDGTVGWIVTIPMTARQMLESFRGSSEQRRNLTDKLVQAVEISKRMGAEIVGLGAMTAPVTRGGATLVGKVNGVGITNGNALTAVVTVRGVLAAAEKAGIDLNSSGIAIVGAAGSVGNAVSLLLAESLGKCQLLLVSRTLGNLRQLKETIETGNKEARVRIFSRISAIKECDLVIVTTSGPDVIIQKEHLKEGTLVYDDTQPKNVSREIARDPNFLVVDGSVVRIPGIRNTMDIGLPGSNDMYACEAEAWLLAKQERFGDFAIGKEVIKEAKAAQEMVRGHRINLAPFTSFGEPLTDDAFRQFVEIRSQSRG